MKKFLVYIFTSTFALSIFAVEEPTKSSKEETKKEAIETKEESKEIKNEEAEANEETKETNNDRPHSLFSFGTDGFGWSGIGSASKFDKDKSRFDELTTSGGKINLNYHYIFPSGVMLGPEFTIEYAKTEAELQSGDKTTEESRTSTLALSLGYNFNKDLFNSWWLKGALGGGSTWTNSEDTTATPQETDSNSTFGLASIEGGKRFSFESWGLKNFTYSPSIVLGAASYGGDAKDAGLESTSFAQINILKFDLLF